jgi:hypothetical protein
MTLALSSVPVRRERVETTLSEIRSIFSYRAQHHPPVKIVTLSLSKEVRHRRDPLSIGHILGSSPTANSVSPLSRLSLFDTQKSFKRSDYPLAII